MNGKRFQRILLAAFAALLAGCGAGSGTGVVSTSGPPPSFTISANPSSITISANVTAQIQVFLVPENGFLGTVSVAVAGLPAGVTTSPAAPFTLPSAGRMLSFTAGASVTNGTYPLTFQGTSGSLSSNASASLSIEPLASFAVGGLTSVLIRQGASALATFNFVDGTSGSTNFDVNLTMTGLPAGVTATFGMNPVSASSGGGSFTLHAASNATLVNNGTAQLVATRPADGLVVSTPFSFVVAPPPGQLLGSRTNFVATDDTPSAMVFDSLHQIVYAALPNRSRVVAISPATGQVVKSIAVPDAKALSLSPDGTRILSTGSTAQKVAWIDTGTQQIVERDLLPIFQPTCPCNPQPVNPGIPLVMANGKVLFVNTSTVSSGVLEWDRVAGQVTRPASAFGTIGARSADGTKAILADASTAFAGAINLYDSKTDSIVATRSFSDTTFAVAANPNASQFAVAVAGEGIYLMDAQLNTVGVARVGGLTTGILYSADGSSLYIVSTPNNVPLISTVSASTFQTVGQAPAYASNIAYFERAPPLVVEIPMAADATGMIFGAGDYGVALDDSINFQNIGAAAVPPVWTIIANPAEGPQAGSTQVTIATQSYNWIPDVWFGNERGTKVTQNSYSQAEATTPPSSTVGPVTVKLFSPDGTVGYVPLGFTYGAVASGSLILAAPPAGGVTAEFFGYGFGSDQAQQPTQVQFGSQNGALTYSDLFPTETPYPFPLEDIRATVPAGTPGAVDVRVTSSAGTAVIPRGLHYVQSVKDYPSADTFQFLLFDPKRNYVYLSAGNHIDVFSVATRQFLTPITPPTLAGKTQVLGLALTPNNSTLLAANTADGSVALIDPDNPQSAQAIQILPAYGYAQPSYLTVTSTGLVFVATENANTEAGITLQMYQIDLATHNVTISTQPNSAMVSSRDGSVVFAYAGYQEAVWTAASGTWTIGHGTQSYFGNVALAGDGNVIAVGSQGFGVVSGAVLEFMDSDTNIISRTGLTAYQSSFAGQIAGLRLNDAGSLAYLPVQFGTSSESISFTENGIDIFDVEHSELRERVMLPEQFPNSGIIGMTTDPSGQNIFLLTTAGLTVVTLDEIPLSIGSITPALGPAGTTVTIRGSGFSSSTAVAVNGNSAAATFIDVDTLQVGLPATLAAGPVSITLTNPDGAYTLDDAFTVQ